MGNGTPKVSEVTPEDPSEGGAHKKVEPVSVEQMASALAKTLSERQVKPKGKTSNQKAQMPKPAAKPKAKAVKADVKKDAIPSMKHPPEFAGTAKRPPIYWGSCTIYTCADK